VQKIIIYFFVCFMGSLCGNAQSNPFLKPGSNRPVPPVVQRPAPPPPKPIPRNPNLEFRGYYEFQGVWKVALFDKVKNQGFWLSKGETVDGIDAEVESFNPDTEIIKLKGGMTLSLRESDKTILPVPSGQVKSPSQPPVPGKPVNPNVKPGRIPPPTRTR
jgi:hypothetical protein